MYSTDQNGGPVKAIKGSTQDSPRSLTELGAALNLLKFVIGLGIISLPEATSHVGWLPSIIGMGMVAFVNVLGIFFALEARKKIEQLEHAAQSQDAAGNVRMMTEGEPLMHVSWRDMPDSGCGFFDKIVGKVFGTGAQYLFAVTIALGQFTTLVIYLNVITESFGSYFPEGSQLVVFSVIVFVLGLFFLIPTMQGVSVLSAMGLAIYTFLFAGLIVELTKKVHAGSLPESAVMVKGSAEFGFGVGQWFGVTCFAFSAFPIAMVIYEDMRDTQVFHKVLGAVFFSIWVIYSSFALFGYLCFGNETHMLIYLNFAEGSTFRNGASAALGGTLALSFMVQSMPVFHCTMRALELSGVAKMFGVATMPSQLPVLRWFVLALVALVAYLVPSAKMMMNTLGAVTGVLSGFIFPAVTYLKLSSADEWLARSGCILVLAIGVLGAGYSCSSI